MYPNIFIVTIMSFCRKSYRLSSSNQPNQLYKAPVYANADFRK